MKNNNLRAEALLKNRNNDGRPKLPLTEKKGYKVTVKLATAEYYSLKSKAKEAGMNLSLFIRNALQGCEVRQRFSAEQLRYILQLTGMANNLNQIARKANAGGYTNARSRYNAKVISDIDFIRDKFILSPKKTFNLSNKSLCL